MSSHDPIAYTYDADTHCPACAEARFGRSAAGFIGEDSEDSEGNPVGIVAPWDTGEWVDGIYCGDCLGEILAPWVDEDDELEDDEDDAPTNPYMEPGGLFDELRQAESQLR